MQIWNFKKIEKKKTIIFIYNFLIKQTNNNIYKNKLLKTK